MLHGLCWTNGGTYMYRCDVESMVPSRLYPSELSKAWIMLSVLFTQRCISTAQGHSQRADPCPLRISFRGTKEHYFKHRVLMTRSRKIAGMFSCVLVGFVFLASWRIQLLPSLSLPNSILSVPEDPKKPSTVACDQPSSGPLDGCCSPIPHSASELFK